MSVKINKILANNIQYTDFNDGNFHMVFDETGGFKITDNTGNLLNISDVLVYDTEDHLANTPLLYNNKIYIVRADCSVYLYKDSSFIQISSDISRYEFDNMIDRLKILEEADYAILDDTIVTKSSVFSSSKINDTYSRISHSHTDIDNSVANLNTRIDTIVDDVIISKNASFSNQHVSETYAKKEDITNTALIDNDNILDDTTSFSGKYVNDNFSKIGESGGSSEINDNAVSGTSTYSSAKVVSDFVSKTDLTDESIVMADINVPSVDYVGALSRFSSAFSIKTFTFKIFGKNANGVYVGKNENNTISIRLNGQVLRFELDAPLRATSDNTVCDYIDGCRVVRRVDADGELMLSEDVSYMAPIPLSIAIGVNTIECTNTIKPNITILYPSKAFHMTILNATNIEAITHVVNDYNTRLSQISANVGDNTNAILSNNITVRDYNTKGVT